MLSEITVVQDDDSGEAWSLQDQWKEQFADAYSLGEACEKAKVFCDANDIKSFTVRLL